MSDPNSLANLTSETYPIGSDAAVQAEESTSIAPVVPSRECDTPLDLGALLIDAGETAYSWDIDSDDLTWADYAELLIDDCDLSGVGTGGAYALLIDPSDVDRRYQAIAGSSETDQGQGVGYCVQYRLRPLGRRNAAEVWVEEDGRWYADGAGRPACARGVIRVINERHQKQRRLMFLTEHDELTGQFNRIRLTTALEGFIEHSKSSGGGTFLMAAVNNLNHVNETFGFAIGDEVLAIVGRRLRNCLRGDDCIGRYSTNKFGLILHDCGPDALAHVAARLLRAAETEAVETSAGALAATIAIGAVLVPRQADCVDDVVCRSLEALEWARVKGASGFAVYKQSEQRESRRRRNMVVADEILRALNERRMMLALQPVVCSKSLEPIYYEALLRMKKPDGAIIPAVDFISVAEELGLARHVDHRVIELTAPLLKRFDDLQLAVNVSGQTVTDPEWFAALEALTEGGSGLSQRIIVEITETALISDIDETARLVEKLKKLGCRVAIDDFGAGYSSFRNLRHLDVDTVKLDGSFIKNLPESRGDQIMVKALIDLAQNLGMETVAEWVGDEPTVKLLQDMSVTYMQGFHFGTPKLVDFSPASAAPRQAV